MKDQREVAPLSTLKSHRQVHQQLTEERTVVTWRLHVTGRFQISYRLLFPFFLWNLLYYLFLAGHSLELLSLKSAGEVVSR